jgi:hypothetical protein
MMEMRAARLWSFEASSTPLAHPFLFFFFLQGERTTWEYHTVILYRVAGYGFGIAVVC